MAVGEIITAARYNAIQAKVSQTLGVGAGTYGYGQTVTSYQVTSSNDVTATHMNYLITDLQKLYAHQTGGVPSLTTVSSTQDINDNVWTQHSAAADTAYLNYLAVYEPTQASVEAKLSSPPRTTVWGGSSDPQSIYHEFVITFNDANHRRHFFNAGGEVRFASSLTSGSGSKYVEWNGMLSAMGTVKFNYTNCTASSGTGYGLGNFDLTTTYTTVFVKTGSGVYSENDYIIKAKTNITGNQILFLIEFNDGDDGGPDVDEPVNGTLTSTISQLRATGAYVVVSTPGYANIQTLA